MKIGHRVKREGALTCYGNFFIPEPFDKILVEALRENRRHRRRTAAESDDWAALFLFLETQCILITCRPNQSLSNAVSAIQVDQWRMVPTFSLWTISSTSRKASAITWIAMSASSFVTLIGGAIRNTLL
jgi:hypothetical protein